MEIESKNLNLKLRLFKKKKDKGLSDYQESKREDTDRWKTIVLRPLQS